MVKKTTSDRAKSEVPSQSTLSTLLTRAASNATVGKNISGSTEQDEDLSELAKNSGWLGISKLANEDPDGAEAIYQRLEEGKVIAAEVKQRQAEYYAKYNFVEVTREIQSYPTDLITSCGQEAADKFRYQYKKIIAHYLDDYIKELQQHMECLSTAIRECNDRLTQYEKQLQKKKNDDLFLNLQSLEVVQRAMTFLTSRQSQSNQVVAYTSEEYAKKDQELIIVLRYKLKNFQSKYKNLSKLSEKFTYLSTDTSEEMTLPLRIRYAAGYLLQYLKKFLPQQPGWSDFEFDLTLLKAMHEYLNIYTDMSACENQQNNYHGEEQCSSPLPEVDPEGIKSLLSLLPAKMDDGAITTYRVIDDGTIYEYRKIGDELIQVSDTILYEPASNSVAGIEQSNQSKTEIASSTPISTKPAPTNSPLIDSRGVQVMSESIALQSILTQRKQITENSTGIIPPKFGSLSEEEILASKTNDNSQLSSSTSSITQALNQKMRGRNNSRIATLPQPKSHALPQRIKLPSVIQQTVDGDENAQALKTTSGATIAVTPVTQYIREQIDELRKQSLEEERQEFPVHTKLSSSEKSEPQDIAHMPDKKSNSTAENQQPRPSELLQQVSTLGTSPSSISKIQQSDGNGDDTSLLQDSQVQQESQELQYPQGQQVSQEPATSSENSNDSQLLQTSPHSNTGKYIRSHN